MSTHCQELKQKITYGEPFFILTKENMSGGTIVSGAAMQRIPLEQRLSEKVEPSVGLNVYAASSSYSNNDSYSWFDIRKEAFLFAITDDVFAQFFPNCKELFEERND
jgi:hypothetical protein